MTASRIRALPVIATLASVIAVACDPALSLRPVGWEPSGEFQWEAESNGVHFVVGSLGGLIRSKSTSFEIAIRNTASSRFVIDGATLETNRTTYAATLSGHACGLSSRCKRA